MKLNYKKTGVYIVAIAIFTSLGGIGGYYLGSNNDGNGTVTPANVSTESQEKNLYDGSNLTLVEMYDSLGASTSEDFDHKLLVYLLAIKQNESGMLRMAEQKSGKETMKKYSTIQMEQNDTVTKMLFDWQKQWGFSHH